MILTDFINSVEGYEVKTYPARGFTKNRRIVVCFDCVCCGKPTERTMHDVRSSLMRSGKLPRYCSTACRNKHIQCHPVEPIPKDQIKDILSHKGYLEKYKDMIVKMANEQLKTGKLVQKRPIIEHLLSIDLTLSKITAGRITIQVFRDMGMTNYDCDRKIYWFDPRFN